MMDTLLGLVDGLKPEELLPDLEMLLSKLAGLARIAVLIGPVALLFFGLVYLFLAPKEANHTFGFRCWWGMGSVEVWQFTQKLSGIFWAAMGLILGLIAFLSGNKYAAMGYEEMLFGAAKLIVWQIVSVLVSIVIINLVIIVLFNHRGEPRFAKTQRTKI